MSIVQTMRGPIDSGQLGRVLVHEHIFLMDPEFVANWDYMGDDVQPI